jgi:hypothetical protein
MIWLSTVSLAAGGLLAQRFKIFVLAPATFVVVVVAIVIGVAQTSGVWSTIDNGYSKRGDTDWLFSLEC